VPFLRGSGSGHRLQANPGPARFRDGRRQGPVGPHNGQLRPASKTAGTRHQKGEIPGSLAVFVLLILISGETPIKVILLSDVKNVGRAGEVKKVSPGFGRNFLLPKRLASAATESALRTWQKSQVQREKAFEANKVKAKDLSGKIGAVALSFSRPVGPDGRIFGSVGKTDIVKSLKTIGFDVDKQAVELATALKAVGEHEVKINFLGDVSAKIKVTIVPRQ
jgi:large subunit ribosomal protein L9